MAKKIWILIAVLALIFSIIACQGGGGGGVINGGIACYNSTCDLNSLNVRP